MILYTYYIYIYINNWVVYSLRYSNITRVLVTAHLGLCDVFLVSRQRRFRICGSFRKKLSFLVVVWSRVTVNLVESKSHFFSDSDQGKPTVEGHGMEDFLGYNASILQRSWWKYLVQTTIFNIYIKISGCCNHPITIFL